MSAKHVNTHTPEQQNMLNQIKTQCQAMGVILLIFGIAFGIAIAASPSSIKESMDTHTNAVVFVIVGLYIAGIIAFSISMFKKGGRLKEYNMLYKDLFFGNWPHRIVSIACLIFGIGAGVAIVMLLPNSSTFLYIVLFFLLFLFVITLAQTLQFVVSYKEGNYQTDIDEISNTAMAEATTTIGKGMAEVQDVRDTYQRHLGYETSYYTKTDEAGNTRTIRVRRSNARRTIIALIIFVVAVIAVILIGVSQNKNNTVSNNETVATTVTNTSGF